MGLDFKTKNTIELESYLHWYTNYISQSQLGTW